MGEDHDRDEIRAELEELQRLVFKDPAAVLKRLPELKSRAEAQEEPLLYGRGMIFEGWAYQLTAQYDKAVEVLTECRVRQEELRDREGLAMTYNALGSVFHYMNAYEKALDNYRKSLDIAREEGLYDRQLAALINKAEVYLDLDHPEDALEILPQAEELSGENGADNNLAGLYGIAARCYMALDRPAQAGEALDKGLAACREWDDYLNWIDLANLSGRNHLRMGHARLALEQHQEALELARSMQNRNGICETLYFLGIAYEFGKDAGRAEACYRECLGIAQDISARNMYVKAAKKLRDIKAADGSYEEAYRWFAAFYPIEQEIAGEQTKKKIFKLKVKYDYENTQRENERIRQRNAELKQRQTLLEEWNRTVETINHIGRAITASLDLKQIALMVYENIRGLLHAYAFGIASYDEQEQELAYSYFIEEGRMLPETRVSLDHPGSYGVHAFKNREMVFLNNAREEWRRFFGDKDRRTPVKGSRKYAGSLIYIPLIMEDQVLGVMSVQSLESGIYRENDKKIVEALGAYVAIALSNIKAHKRLQDLNAELTREKQELEEAGRKIERMAKYDALTGLPNRNLLYEVLQRAMRRARRRQEKVGLIFIDLDNFKPINDNYGHNIGDEVLKKLGERLTAAFRQSDTIARFGGDEFVVVVESITCRDDCWKVARKIQGLLEKTVEVEENRFSVSASIGTCLFPDEAEDIDAMISQADSRMYEAKKRGKA